MVKPIQCTSRPTLEGASAMSDSPPPPPGMPPFPPPPPPPGFEEGNGEDEVKIPIENDGDDGSEMNNIHQLVGELPSLEDIERPPPPPPGIDTPPSLPPGFDTPPPLPLGVDNPPPPPPGYEVIEEEGEWDVDELDIQSFNDTLTSLEQLNEKEVA